MIFQLAAAIADPGVQHVAKPILIHDERFMTGFVGMLIYGAVHGSWWLFRKIGAKRSKKALEAILGDGGDTAPAAHGGEYGPAMVARMDRMLVQMDNLIQAVSVERASYLDRLEEISREGRDERARQWERIERLTDSMHNLTSGMASAVNSFNQRHDETGRTLVRIESSQISLATWIYQRLSGGAAPSPAGQNWPHQGFPPAAGRNGG